MANRIQQFAQGLFQIDPGATPETAEKKRQMLTQMLAGNRPTTPIAGVADGLTRAMAGWGMGNLNKAEDAKRKGASDWWADVRNQSSVPASGGPLSVLGMREEWSGGTPFAASAPQPGPSAANPQTGTTQPFGIQPGGLPGSLVQSESGGNWQALNSEGYGGRGQFGEARLADAARAGVIPAGMTGAQYSQAPQETQLAVENWHRGDVLKDLGQYVGVDPDGPGPIPPLTEDSLLAVAHLGGKGGARRFVESGGQYNPADSNGTSLADYATRHAGGGAGGGMQMPATPAYNGPPIAALQEAVMNPWLSQEERQMAASMLDQAMQASDPLRQLQMQQMQMEIAQMGQPERQGLVNAGAGNIFDPNTGQWIIAPQGPATPMSALGKLEADRAAGLISDEAYQAELASMAPDGMSIESDGQGGFRMVQGAGVTGNTRPFTEGQSKDVVYSTRARGALEALEPVSGALADRGDRALEYVPFGFGREAQSSDYQVAQNAGNEFLQAILRKDTGAAITEQEQALYGKTYLPAPGDGPEVLAQKQQARARAISAIEAGMSPAQMIAQERGLQGGREVAAPEAPAVDFTNMTPAQLGQVDLEALSDAELDAYLEATK